MIEVIEIFSDEDNVERSVASISSQAKMPAETARGRSDPVVDNHDIYSRSDSSSIDSILSASSTFAPQKTEENADEAEKSCQSTKSFVIAPSPKTPSRLDPREGTWKIIILMDQREFNRTEFINTLIERVNKYFHGKSFVDHVYPQYCEKLTLPSADYMFVARKICNSTGQVLDERVLDLIIERKEVNDLCACLIQPSKKYKPLTFFEAQMYKMQQLNVLTNKIFLMEGDEDRVTEFYQHGIEMERNRRLKRVKTLRVQIEKGEFRGVKLACTKCKNDTVLYLLEKMELLQKIFNPRQPPTLTMAEFKSHIDEHMKNSTFQKYLKLRNTKGIGDVKAMKIIMDPESSWDKSFLSPASTSKSLKANLMDRATYYVPKLRRSSVSSQSSNKLFPASSDLSDGMFDREATEATAEKTAKMPNVTSRKTTATPTRSFAAETTSRNVNLNSTPATGAISATTTKAIKSIPSKRADGSAEADSSSGENSFEKSNKMTYFSKRTGLGSAYTNRTATKTSYESVPEKRSNKTSKTNLSATNDGKFTNSGRIAKEIRSWKGPDGETFYIRRPQQTQQQALFASSTQTIRRPSDMSTDPVRNVQNSIAVKYLLNKKRHDGLLQDLLHVKYRSPRIDLESNESSPSSDSPKSCTSLPTHTALKSSAAAKAATTTRTFIRRESLKTLSKRKQSEEHFLDISTSDDNDTASRPRKKSPSDWQSSCSATNCKASIRCNMQECIEVLSSDDEDDTVRSGCWVCNNCTFINRNTRFLTCEVCSEERK